MIFRMIGVHAGLGETEGVVGTVGVVDTVGVVGVDGIPPHPPPPPPPPHGLPGFVVVPVLVVHVFVVPVLVSSVTMTVIGAREQFDGKRI